MPDHTLPPSNYPKQEDYGKLCLVGKDLINQIHDAFLHGNLDEANRLAGDMFQNSYNILNLCCQLKIDEVQRAKRGLQTSGIEEAVTQEVPEKGLYERIVRF